MYDLAQFVMLWQAGVADNREDTFDIGIEETLAKNALPDHACRSEENHFHQTASRGESVHSRVPIPLRVRRPSAAREALLRKANCIVSP